VTQSEQRLHPVSILFALGKSLKGFLIPGIVVLFGARSTGGFGGPFGAMPENWELWAMWLLVPITITAAVRYFTFRIRYEEEELVIRSGLLFRNERHIPYHRIQNLNAIRNVFHRMIGMTDVQIETGSGQKAEATISVVPLAVLDEMRARVFHARAGAGSSDRSPDRASDVGPARGLELLRLPFDELAMLSVIQNRGLLPIAAILGLSWEFGLLERVFGTRLLSGGAFREFVRFVDSGQFQILQLGGLLAAIVAAVVIVQSLSLLWVVTRLHGFVLTRVGEDLRTDYGLLTRVATTIPLRRLQTLTVEQGPMQRLVNRASVRIETAGGGSVPSGGMSVKFGEDANSGARHWLAPIVRVSELPILIKSVLPELDTGALEWQPLHPRAFRRAIKKALFLAAIMGAALVFIGGVWLAPLLPLLFWWTWFATRRRIERTAWSTTDGIAAYRTGWVFFRLTVARTTKIQVVTRVESPFDRRASMARVAVHTAGAGEWSHRVDIPYLGADVADTLYRHLALQAATTEFRW
jgi:putative membrane protein